MRRAVTIAVLLAILSIGIPLPVDAADASARLTEAHGKVYTRGFRDWEKELWDDPQPAAVGAILTEGMQLGTGDKSWAQVTWTYITTRAWANSVYAIAPNKRLVYLTNGEMLYHLDKKRKGDDPYYVWTKLLSARVRGTSLFVQCTGDVSRITVLEGCIDVFNRVDHSRIRLKPGVVYEVRDPQATGSPQTDIVSANQNPVTLFETEKTVTRLYAADPEKLNAIPVLTGFSEPFVSQNLIQTSLTKLGEVSALEKLLKSSAEILSVPTALNYRINDTAKAVLSLPAASLQFFPPHDVAALPQHNISTPLNALPPHHTLQQTLGLIPTTTLTSTAGRAVDITTTTTTNLISNTTRGIQSNTLNSTINNSIGGTVGNTINNPTGTIGGILGGLGGLLGN